MKPVTELSKRKTKQERNFEAQLKNLLATLARSHMNRSTNKFID